MDGNGRQRAEAGEHRGALSRAPDYRGGVQGKGDSHHGQALYQEERHPAGAEAEADPLYSIWRQNRILLYKVLKNKAKLNHSKNLLQIDLLFIKNCNSLNVKDLASLPALFPSLFN